MNKFLPVILLIAALQSTVVFAEQNTQKNPEPKRPASFATPLGMLTGAAIAGPVGVIVATTLGIIFDRQREDKFELQLALHSGKKMHREENLAHQRKVARLLTEQSERDAQYLLASREWNATFQSGFEKSVSYSMQFRTDSSAIEPHYINQLDGLVQLLKNAPKLSVRLAGHADQLGEENYNQELSLKRVEAIEGYLVDAGVKPSRIQSYAYGESSPLNQHTGIEENPFERRVTIDISPSRQAVVSY